MGTTSNTLNLYTGGNRLILGKYNPDAADSIDAWMNMLNGNVGIGIGGNYPIHPLVVNGLIYTMQDGIKFPDLSIQHTAAVGDGFSLDAADGDPTDALIVDTDGNIGIGTITPMERLDVFGAIKANKFVDQQNSNFYLNPGGESTLQDVIFGSITLGGETHTSWPPSQDNDWIIDGNNIYAAATGNVGIGTTDAGQTDAKLTVKTSDDQHLLFKGYNNQDQVIVEIGEGLDYAETFPVSASDITPGTVMVIDPDAVGNLKVSTQPYDRKVAGIVSGAQDLSYGMRLGATNIDGLPVALAGRVYCNVDTSYGDIHPGDLLTTSPTPGHAMVVTDYTLAQGAIIGKAMQGVSGGQTSQILVLVTLQ
jgi:hypothetical protein